MIFYLENKYNKRYNWLDIVNDLISFICFSFFLAKKSWQLFKKKGLVNLNPFNEL